MKEGAVHGEAARPQQGLTLTVWTPLDGTDRWLVGQGPSLPDPCAGVEKGQRQPGR